MDVQRDAVTSVSRLHGSLHMGPGFGFGDWTLAQHKPFYREGLAALHALGADLVRYQGWHDRPDLVIAEPEPPAGGKTSWDFSRIDPPFLEFLEANCGRHFVMNSSTPPTWATSPEAMADYFGRFVRWYVQGGFVDEAGKRHASGHRIAFPYWEVLNEPDFESATTPGQYTARYDLLAARRLLSPLKKSRPARAWAA